MGPAEIGQKETPSQVVDEAQKATLKRQANNNRYVVPIGLLVVLLTLYLTATVLLRNSTGRSFGQAADNGEIVENLDKVGSKQLPKELGNGEDRRRSFILEKLLEHESVCTDLEVFTRDAGGTSPGESQLLDSAKPNKANIRCPRSHRDNNISQPSSSHKHRKRKIASKRSAVRTGYRLGAKSNKLAAAKLPRKAANGKREQQTKRNSTAEPIIYLFALVFIYLLLKAASDISQHYKSQNKGDKRLRRCSLQSYAQQHRPERRSSKGISSKSMPKF